VSCKRLAYAVSALAILVRDQVYAGSRQIL
jgi:hypothetical protein